MPFRRNFHHVPQVSIGVSKMSMDSTYAGRLKLIVRDVTTTGMTYNIEVWDDTVLVALEGTYLVLATWRIFRADVVYFNV